MREILFRGKRIEDGKWIYGYYLDGKTSMADFPCITPFSGDAYDDDNDWEVDIETVGQFTGLTDKNGIRIFEGDIIQDSNYPEYVFRIEYHNGTIIASEIHTFDKVYLDNFICFNIFEAFVIGNIHDNPELLNK